MKEIITSRNELWKTFTVRQLAYVDILILNCLHIYRTSDGFIQLDEL